MEIIKFNQALKNIGSTNSEIADKLGIPVRTLIVYKSGKFPRIISNLMRYPSLLRALAEDAEMSKQRAA